MILSTTQQQRVVRGMKIQRLFPTVGVMVDLDLGSDDQMQRTEKNWSPIIANGSQYYLFSRQIEPHEIVRCNTDGGCQKIAGSSNIDYFDKFKATWAISVSERHTECPLAIFMYAILMRAFRLYSYMQYSYNDVLWNTHT